LRKKPAVAVKPPQYDDGVVRVGQCPACRRENTLLTKHEENAPTEVWSCADVEGCSQVVAAAATVVRTKARAVAKDVVRKVIDEGD